MAAGAFFPAPRPPRLGKVPSLEDLCVQSAIDNLQHLSDVGQTDIRLLAKILPHCTPEQLHRIEIASSKTDLSPVTNDLWRKFYARQFGTENLNIVLERMKSRKLSFKWHLLYQAKLKEQEETQKKSVDRLKQLYKQADMLKQSRQTQVCTKVPPSKKRKTFDIAGGSSNQYRHIKGRLMRKSRMEFAASCEMRTSRPLQRSIPLQCSLQKSSGSGSAQFHKPTIQPSTAGPNKTNSRR